MDEKTEVFNLVKSNFLGRMSHEMRTPLNAIIGMTTLARSAADEEKRKYCLSKIEEASNHLLGMIDNMLDLSKLEQGKFEIYNDEVELKYMLQMTASTVKFTLKEKHISYDYEIDPDIPDIIITDEYQLSHIILNLLYSAIKNTPPQGTINTKISKTIQEKTGKKILNIKVHNSGPGLNIDQQKDLLGIFEQADESTEKLHSGTGVGLAIVKGIIEFMGGSISIESVPKQGATLFVELPYDVQKTGEAEEKDEADASKTDTAVAQEATEDDDGQIFKGLNLLVVEDVELNREIVISILEDTGLNIDSAENGVQAVEMYKKDPAKYNLILMDIHMPEMDGYEATKQIRAMEKELMEKGEVKKRLPIIAMTANVFRSDIEKCLEVGMDSHLGKPIDFEQVLIELQKYLL